MPILLLAHPQVASLLQSKATIFCTQNLQESQKWLRENSYGIILIDLDSCTLEQWDFLLPNYVYIGFSAHFSKLKEAQHLGLDIALHKHLYFVEHVHSSIENAQKSLALKRHNQELQEVLTQKNADQDISLLLGGIAHDFNNILSIIMGSTKVMMRTHNIDEMHQELLQSILEASHHGRDLSKQLMQYQNKKSEYCAIDTVLGRIGGLIKKVLPSNINLNITRAPDIRLNISATELIRILMNLILNARDAMPKGGEISIHTHALQSFVRIEVEDNGMGMPENVRTRIFEPFYTTKKDKGTGLGLAGVHSIVTKKRGRILCESTENKGTKFIVDLPNWKAPNIFILDTNTHRAQELQSLLHEQGHTSLHCQNIADLIQQTQQAHAPLGTIVVTESFAHSFPFEIFIRQYLILCGTENEDALWNAVLPPQSSAEQIFTALPLQK
jgi:signal transduction histidine kinase